MAPKKSSDVGTGAVRTVHALYYYVVIAGTVLAISIASFVLLRRVLIDTVLPDLRVDYNEYSYYSCDLRTENSTISREECEQENQERADREYRRTRAEQYLYSILTVIIASVVMGTHIMFFKPEK
jgi:hypothetical protein